MILIIREAVRDRLPTPVFLGFPGGSDSKESTCNVRDPGLNHGLGRSPGGGHGNPLQYSCLENPHGQRSLAGYSPWGHRESVMADQLSQSTSHPCAGIRIYEKSLYFPNNFALKLKLLPPKYSHFKKGMEENFF